MELRCPDCDHNLKVPERLVGKKGKCQNCGKIIDIPFFQEIPEIITYIHTNLEKKNEASNTTPIVTSKESGTNNNSVNMSIQTFSRIIATSFIACVVGCIILAKIYPSFGFVFSFVAATIIFIVVAKRNGVRDIGFTYFICIVAVFWFAVIIFAIIQSI